MPVLPVRSGALLIGLVGLAGLVIQARVSFTLGFARGFSTAAIISKYLSYFTIVTNLLLSATQLLSSLAPTSRPGQLARRPSIQGGLLLYISVVGVVYVAVLARLWHPQGLQLWADVILHYATPLLSLAFWVAAVPKLRLGWILALEWLWFPGVYLVWALIRGAFTGDYPYPFIDVHALGYSKALVGAAVVTGLFTVGGLVIIAASRAIANRTAR